MAVTALDDYARDVIAGALRIVVLGGDDPAKVDRDRLVGALVDLLWSRHRIRVSAAVVREALPTIVY